MDDIADKLAEALEHAVQAADLALFVIRKQGVMPNSSWAHGFETDMKIARATLAEYRAQKGGG